MVTVRKQPFGYTLYELAVCAAVLAVLAGLLLMRVQSYSAEAEHASVNRLVGTLRAALQLRMLDASRHDRQYGIERLREENPLDWLDRKPDNYVGEYYAPDLEKIPQGNWLFDRRDKTLVYLPNNGNFSSYLATKFLKFKVESAQLYGHGPGQVGRKQDPVGLELHEVSQPPADTLENQ
jgi:general secretion pathway protein G